MDKDHKDILNKLNLSGSGFKTPEDYFDKLEDRLAKKVAENKSLKKLVIIRPNELKTQRKDTGFKVPIDYFKEVETRVIKSLDTKKRVSKVRRLSFISLSIAASILLFFGIQFMNKGQHNLDQIVLQSEEVASWVDEDLISFDTYEIAEAFSDIELEHPFYSDEAVNDYLDFIDIESLIIEN